MDVLTSPDLGLLVLRLIVGLLFIGHGTQKLFGWFGGPGLDGFGGFLSSMGVPNAGLAAIVVALSETLGGLLFALGAWTGVAAILIIGVMVGAVLMAHLPNGVWNSDGGFEFPLTNLAAALAVALVGPGSWSVDASGALPTLPDRWLVVGIVGAVIVPAVLDRLRQPPDGDEA